MNVLTLAVSADMHRFARGFVDVAAVFGLIVVSVIAVELILMVPDLIRTIRIHRM